MAGYRFTFFLILLVLIHCDTVYAQNFDPVLLEKHLKLIQTAHESDYSVQLEKLFSKVKNQGASIEAVMVSALGAGISHADFIISSINVYPDESVVSSAIKSGGDPEEVIKTAILSNGDPMKIIAGAIEAGIAPADAEAMVAAAMKLKKGKPEENGSPGGESRKGPSLTPVPGAAFPGGGSGGEGVAGPGGEPSDPQSDDIAPEEGSAKGDGENPGSEPSDPQPGDNLPVGGSDGGGAASSS
ncbi:MAG: hypothetical protein R6X10_18815 [Desulfobacterales bacterium]